MYGIDGSTVGNNFIATLEARIFRLRCPIDKEFSISNFESVAGNGNASFNIEFISYS